MDPESTVQASLTAVRALEYIQDDHKAIVDLLINVINQIDEPKIRWVGVTMIGNIGSRANLDVSNAVIALLQQLDNPEWFVRSSALAALRKLSPQVNEEFWKH